MQKRDKSGRFLKGKVVKKKKKIAIKKGHKDSCDYWNEDQLPRKVKVQKVKKGHLRPNLNELSLYDLQDMIQAEVMFQMKEIW